MMEMRPAALRLSFAAPPGGLRFRPAGAAVFAVLTCIVFPACFYRGNPEPRVQVSQLVAYPGPSRGPDCNMPILRVKPLERHLEIAIVEGWAGSGQGERLLAQLKRTACETGADALLVLEDRAQITTQHLYRVTPNMTSEAAAGGTSAEASRPGYYLSKEEHVARIGEPGHSGDYIDAVAIVYGRQRN